MTGSDVGARTAKTEETVGRNQSQRGERMDGCHLWRVGERRGAVSRALRRRCQVSLTPSRHCPLVRQQRFADADLGALHSKQDQYLVSDRSNHRIQVLTASGRYPVSLACTLSRSAFLSVLILAGYGKLLVRAGPAQESWKVRAELRWARKAKLSSPTAETIVW